MYINGTLLYSSSSSAITSVSSGQSVLVDAVTTTAGQVSVVNNGVSSPHAIIGSKGEILMSSAAATESVASLTLTNGLGNTHGIVVTEQQLVLSGGTHSTTMILDDGGATFQNTQSGGPARVTGVADGSQPYDAVNYRQIKSLETRVSEGVAMSSALSSIPQVDTNKRYLLGAGVGYFNNETAVAVGGSVRVAKNGIIKAGVAYNAGSKTSTHAGFGFSW
jgi:hypothetical protein